MLNENVLKIILNITGAGGGVVVTKKKKSGSRFM